MKIAVVGAGAAGLVAAHRLSADHDVALLEAAARPGGHAWTIDVPLPGREPLPVDVGFLVLNDRNYPQFEALLAELGVPTQPSDMSFSVSDGKDFEYAGNGFGGLFANRGHLRDAKFLKMVFEYARFNRDAQKLLASEENPSLRAWLRDLGYSQLFVEGLLVPQASAVWSADPEQMWSFPARFLVQFFDNHGMLGFRDRPEWRTIPGGSRRYVEAICARLGDRVRLGTPVATVRRVEGGGVEVVPEGGAPEAFDEVVLATHSDQALKLLERPTELERELLGAIPYLPSELVLHHDERMLPRRRAAWASWNHHILDPTPPLPTVTYWLNNLQGHAIDRELLVTLNRTQDIDPAKVYAQVEVAHPVYTPEGVAAQGRWAEVSGADRVHFCGAYWSWGFHEDGIGSGARVAAAIAARPVESLAA